jgi:hypothetical protein
MKFNKKIILPVLVCCGILVSVVSCTDESIDATDVAVKSKSSNASRRLFALDEKEKPSEEEKKMYVKLYKSLSVDELIEFRKMQTVKAISENSNRPDVIEAAETDIQWFKNINTKSIELFGKPINQVSGLQIDQVLLAYDAKNSKQARVAKGCPVVGFNDSFINQATEVYPEGFAVLGVREVQQPPEGKDNSKDDCDCELKFGTTNPDFKRLYPLSGAAQVLLATFGELISGSVIKNGVKKGFYPVFGAGRVKIVYAPVINFSSPCNIFLENQFLLTSKRNTICPTGQVWSSACKCCNTISSCYDPVYNPEGICL